MIDDKINLKFGISFICSRISRNTGFFCKLRYHGSPLKLKPIYYILIHTPIFPIPLLLGEVPLSPMQKFLKLNHVNRIIFFSSLCGKNPKAPYR